MTHDEIENMPAGREMDVLISGIMEPKPRSVAIGVLRKTEKDWRYSYFGKSSPRGWWHAFIGTDAGADDNLALWEPYWRVSEEIDSAWAVFEFISDKFASVNDPEPEILQIWRGTGRWHVSKIWLHHDGDIQVWCVSAETAPLAICRAALMAVAK